MYQQTAWLITIILSILVILVFLWIFGKSDRRTDYGKVQKKGYFLRNIWFLVLFSGLVTAIYFTLQDLPFERTAGKGMPIAIDVTALQFGFELSQTEFQVGDYVAFQVTSDDVNHGFGLYNENHTIVAQTQAMPDYTNTVYYQFQEPGTYEVLCLEYCGIAHHIMKATITVTE